MTNEKTLKKQEELFVKDCKLINLKYEYMGYTRQEKWAIVSELSEQELFEKYPNEVKKYIPFVLLSVEQGKAIQAYNRNEDKYRKRQNNNGDAYGYDDGTTENMHLEVSVLDFIEQQEMDDYLKAVMQTICATGIRVSELRFITVESVQNGRVEISSKGKRRMVFLPDKLRQLLRNYVRKQKRPPGWYSPPGRVGR